MSKTIFQIGAEFSQIEEILDESGGELTDEISTALAINKTELQNKADGYLALILKCEAEATTADNEVKRVTAIKKQADNKVKALKGAVDFAMKAYGITEIKCTNGRFSFRKSTTVEVEDVELLPEKFIRVKVSKEAEKADIKKAIEGGEVIPGASLKENQNLQVK